jgi:hypothetical protein
MKLNDEIDCYRYLWDGSEDWVLNAYDRLQMSLTVSFAGDRATIQEIMALRKLITAYQNTPVIQIKSLLGDRKEIDIGVLYEREAYRILARAKELDLTIVSKRICTTYYIPIDRNNCALIIENDDLSKRVTAKMLEAGVPIVADFHIH